MRSHETRSGSGVWTWGNLLLLMVGTLSAQEASIHWEFAPPDATGAVRPQVSTGQRLVAIPAKGRLHRREAVLGWDKAGGGLHFANGIAAQNDEGVFLRVADHHALTGHNRGNQGFSSLRLSARVRLDSVGRTQSLLRKTEFASEVGYLLCISSNGQVRFAVGTWAGRASVHSGDVRLATGRWYDVTGVWENGKASVLVDGKPCGSTASVSGMLGQTSGPLAIGALDRGRGSTGQFLDGTLQAVRIQGVASKTPAGGQTMAKNADTTAWGSPVRRMWACPPHDWGRPALGMPILKGVCHAPIFEPEYQDGAYNHHPEIIHHHGRFHAMWSNNRIGEDRAGQRILYSTTNDPTHWPTARLLFPEPGPFFDDRKPTKEQPGRRGFYMTAMKFLPLGKQLFAVASFDGTGEHLVPLVRQLHADGSWGEVFALHSDYDRTRKADFPFAFADPTEEPLRTTAAQLLKLYLTPEFLPSWDFGIGHLLRRPKSVEGTTLCEWTIHRTRDGKHVMLARDPRMSHRMYAAISDSADPNSFPALQPTDIPDTPSKAVTLNLADGTVLLIGNQLAKEFDSVDKPTHYDRDPLTVSISTDGYRFQRQLALRWEGGRRWRTERRKVPGRGQGCQYPAAMLKDGTLYVIYSIGKEDIALSWVPLHHLNLRTRER
ncbi:MAG: hypothetical protein HN904_00115 [Victivallales bacterium]|nr:hypothetical protein [Victivallales bacterium]